MMEEAEDGDSFAILVNDKTRNHRSPMGTLSPPRPDVILDTSGGPFISLDINGGDSDESSIDCVIPGNVSKMSERVRSFLLMDEGENMQQKSSDIFCKKLSVAPEAKIKVVSIFGNSGDGKSHTMNHTFFGGKEVFKTSAEQASCTMGIWAAFYRPNNVLCLDTEGLLGETTNENRQMRMLLKVLAISDIVIYRTRSERLRSDMYTFLGNASKAYSKYFSAALQSLKLSEVPQCLGPAVIIFHETQNTEVLKEDDEGKKEEDILRERFAKMKLELTAFSSLRYVGVRTNKHPTNFEQLRMALERELNNTTVRSPRQPKVVFETLEALNQKFNGELSSVPHNTFPEQYFTCTTFCKSCEARCQLSMGHLSAGEDHKYVGACRYQHQYENKVLMCNNCHTNGRQVVVTQKTQTSCDSSWIGLAKYAWSGSVIECPHCGEIYRARQHWYGNKSPEQDVVRTEIVHVWNDNTSSNRSPAHSAQMVLDGMTYLGDAVASVSAQPAKSLVNMLNNAIRPDYWEPDDVIITCRGCDRDFEKYGLYKHHCRDCGKGFCNACSGSKMLVLSRNWNYPVRVCNGCRTKLIQAQRQGQENGGIQGNSQSGEAAEVNITARKYGEVLVNTFANIGAVLEYPKDYIKNSARPSYWVPDSEAPRCNICRLVFGVAEEIDSTTAVVQPGPSSSENDVPDQLAAAMADDTPSHSSSQSIDRRRHHCRACGNAVCASCSEHSRPVPKRGWTNAVRVCNNCILGND
ncbi:zinc finger FYVE domain-containing protein 1-like isoform X2 [Toxorhynchites rutilus septentrionalis]|uniref:zinc finger FYVE domain-containing protein 1-like isoform X2 n=1 Tax=Toxorhynchites rutilus septentrionalis TaxID=329112 RepID=UPI00247A1532|nr:zinc finger FYVE domain-containing protein 1-like isoform X2 [Toxorhynchites rutilus septentrionalis]